MGRRSGGSARSGCRATTRGRGGTGGPWPAGPGPRRPDRRPGRSTSTWPSPTRWSRSARPRPPRGRGWAGSRRRGGPEGRRGRAHRPGLVVRVGGAPTSKALTGWLDESVPQVLVDPAGGWADPARAAALRLTADPSELLAATAALLAPDGPAAGPGPHPGAGEAPSP